MNPAQLYAIKANLIIFKSTEKYGELIVLYDRKYKLRLQYYVAHISCFTIYLTLSHLISLSNKLCFLSIF